MPVLDPLCNKMKLPATDNDAKYMDYFAHIVRTMTLALMDPPLIFVLLQFNKAGKLWEVGKLLLVVSEQVLEIESKEREPLPSNSFVVPEIFIADKRSTNDLSRLF
jgi:hypothetical protein